jgi:exonuclease III
MDLTDIYITFHPNTKEYSFFSVAHRTFSKIDHILEHKESLRQCKIVEITPQILSNYHVLKLDIINNRNNRKYTNS